MIPTAAGPRLVIEEVPTLDSTNSELLRREALLPDGASAVWLVAAHQTAGRGRRQRSWLSAPPASLTASFGREATAAAGIGTLSLVAGVAVAEALEAFGVTVRLKWPNDLYVPVPRPVGERTHAKAGGLLCEARARGDVTRLVIGVGLNLLAPPGAGHLEQPVAGLFRDDAMPERRLLIPALGTALLTATDRWLADGFAPFRARWEALDLLQGREVVVHRSGTSAPARACGIDDDGALRVRYAADGAVGIAPSPSSDGAVWPERLLAEEVSVRVAG